MLSIVLWVTTAALWLTSLPLHSSACQDSLVTLTDQTIHAVGWRRLTAVNVSHALRLSYSAGGLMRDLWNGEQTVCITFFVFNFRFIIIFISVFSLDDVYMYTCTPLIVFVGDICRLSSIFWMEIA